MCWGVPKRITRGTTSARPLDRRWLLNRTIGAGLYHHKYSLLLERVTDHDPKGFGDMAVRNRLWKVRPKQIILATGALERPLTFADNDRPGVMLSTAMRGFAQRYGVIAGEKIAIFTNNDEGYRTANMLHGAGANVTGIIDIRQNAQSPATAQAIELPTLAMTRSWVKVP